ncbi:transcriptional regulator [Loktanella sp. D2R18]|uniref:transcriptional regulator n=1 Tax=Rhodobacterales TaxID=204455 RepID=UPI000DEB010F|nr:MULTISPECIES: transcriptional regulator [Rhodobacterales]MDO6591906.1 transcriptional regulator [Yoonia sp. 1_MG-2023]RBW42663.1 transcriptional regulator [Loktanella sp. D2R18]
MDQGTPSQKNLLQEIRDTRSTLSTKMRKIADFALDQPEDFIRQNSKDVSKALGTSEPTLIRFCKIFGVSGVAEFRINLALSLVAEQRKLSAIEPQAADRRSINRSGKMAIAQAAVNLVQGESALLLDNGSTAEIFALAIKDLPPTTIMTSGLLVAQAALSHGKHNVVVTGGTVRQASMCMTGRLVLEAVRDTQFDTFIMGADCISLERGISTFLEDEAQNTRILMGAARRTVVLVDGSKFDKPSLHRICGIDQVDCIVTDLPHDSEIARQFAHKGINLEFVSSD